ncbi:MAG: hypothetical protein RLZZ475_2537, partial [Pseudomonadota bacterium]
KDWQKKIRAMQTRQLGPCLDRLDVYMIPSALGSVPEKVDYDFDPLEAPDADKDAARFKTVAEALNIIAGLGTMPEQAFNEAAQNTLVEGEWMPGLSQVLAAVPEDERFGISADPAIDVPTPAGNGGDPILAPGGPTNGPPVAAADAAPRSLYVQRKLINAAEFIAWAKSQGFETTTPADELHVTVAYSRQPLDWMKVGSDWHGDDKGTLTVPPGGARIVEPLGDAGAVVLLFNSSALSWRHEAIKRAGASFDFDAYQPHVTITYQAPAGLDLAKVEPFRGALVFGPEVFEEINDDWAANIGEA